MSTSIIADQADPNRSALYKGMEVRQQDEYQRLRLQHELHKAAMNDELVRVPLSKTAPVRILDSATGDGLWMLDVSKQYPNDQFLGTDIFPKHFEQIRDMPPSVSFKVHSVLDEWPPESQNAYDLVHQRYCLVMFNPVKEEAIVKRLFGLVKPGGYIQLVDANLLGFRNGEAHPGMSKMMAFMQRAFPEAGMNPAPGPLIGDWVRRAGGLDVSETVLSFPMGKLAATAEAQEGTTGNLCAMIDNFAMIASKKPDYWYSQDDFKVLKEEVITEMANTGNTWCFWVVTARKSTSST